MSMGTVSVIPQNTSKDQVKGGLGSKENENTTLTRREMVSSLRGKAFCLAAFCACLALLIFEAHKCLGESDDHTVQ